MTSSPNRQRKSIHAASLHQVIAMPAERRFPDSGYQHQGLSSSSCSMTSLVWAYDGSLEWEQETRLWSGSMKCRGLEALETILQGNAEFEASDVALGDSHQICRYVQLHKRLESQIVLVISQRVILAFRGFTLSI